MRIDTNKQMDDLNNEKSQLEKNIIFLTETIKNEQSEKANVKKEKDNLMKEKEQEILFTSVFNLNLQAKKRR